MAILNIPPESQYEDGMNYDDLVNIVGGGPTAAATSAPAQTAPWEPLAQQISQQWQQYGISPDIKGINRANELAQILANYGITDLSKLGIKETPYEEQINVSGGGEGVPDVWETVKRNRGQLTYGDQTFGRLGGFGSKGQQEFAAPQEFLQEAGDGRYGLGYSAAGKGWTEFEAVKDASGKTVIVPRWGSSSDLTPELMQFLAVAAAPFTGGLSAALAPAVGAAAAPILSQALVAGTLGGLGAEAQGGSFGKGFGRGAIAGGFGAAAAPYLGQLGSEAGKIVGGGTIGDIVSGAVQGAGRGAVGAVITGDSVLDALLTGAAGGATSAGANMLVKGANSTLGEYLKDVPAPVKNAVLSAASAGILGKDIDKAVINSFMRDLMRDIKPGALTKGLAGDVDISGSDAIEGFFAPGGEGYVSTGMSAPERMAFLEANIEDPETVQQLMQQYYPELYQAFTPSRSIRDVGPVTQVQPGEQLEGAEIAVPDLLTGLSTVPVAGARPSAKPSAAAQQDLSALLALLGQGRRDREEEYEVARILAESPFGRIV